MGKGKKEDQAKKEAKKARQASKQEKAATKRNKKSNKDAGEQDIDAILAEFNAKEAARTAVSVTSCQQPAPRANCTVTGLQGSAGEMLLFGGEFCDGQNTEVYSDLFRWQVERNEWKHIESLNTPPPRCSHQAVFYKDKVYMFGGEYATMNQFHHYRDFWELDLKTSTWTEVKCTGDIPSARSGHRMVVWRGFIVLFGGFYEAMRDQRWYNDCYIYSFQDHRWSQVPQRPNMQLPKPRSGVCMCVNANEDAVYIYGGFSKEKVTGSLKEGKVHEDMWALLLRPTLPTGGKASSGGNSCGGLDLTKAVWQKIKRKGDYPSTRCGSAMTLYRNKALLFGGVCDEEGPRHTMISTFYSDLHAYDFERKRWYKLGLKQKKEKLSAAERKEARKAKSIKKAAEGDDLEGSHDEEEEEEDEEEDEDENNDHFDDHIHSASNNLFGYIDETGKVVYIDITADDEEESEENAQTITGKENSDLATEAIQSIDAADAPAMVSEVLQTGELVEKADSLIAQLSAVAVADDNAPSSMEASEVKPDDCIKGGNSKTGSDVANAAATPVAHYFSNLIDPCPRINPCLIIRGNTLYIYGGVTELGDVEVTLDDCWSLDLNKRDSWRKVLSGTMHEMVWRGAEEAEDDDDEDDDDEEGRSGKRRDDDSEDDSDEEDDDDMDQELDQNETPEKKSKKRNTSKAVSIKQEMEALRSHLDTTNASRTPLAGESLRQFYSRTAGYWAEQVVEDWRLKQERDGNVSNNDDKLSEKDIKRLGFGMAEQRYNDLLPMLERLNELEQQQQEEEVERRHGSSSRRFGGSPATSSTGGVSKKESKKSGKR